MTIHPEHGRVAEDEGRFIGPDGHLRTADLEHECLTLPARTETAGSHRRLDWASLALLVVGLLFGAVSCWLITSHGMNVLLIVPSIVAATTRGTPPLKDHTRKGSDSEGDE